VFAWVLEAAKSAERDVPDYLSVDGDSSKLADVPYPVSMEPNLVVEFYSR
jgi:small subunit ribosomal protein S4